MRLETVRVVREGSPKGYHTINKSDFVEGVDVLYQEAQASGKDALIALLAAGGITPPANASEAKLTKLAVEAGLMAA